METRDGHHPGLSNAGTGRTVDRSPDRKLSVQEPPDLSPLCEPFHILERTADGQRVIAPCGELDVSTAAQLKERLAGNRNTILDLSDLSFIDSTGIYALVSTAQRARSEAWEFTVRNPQPAVLHVIKLVGLAEHLGLEHQTPPDEHMKQPSPTP